MSYVGMVGPKRTMGTAVKSIYALLVIAGTLALPFQAKADVKAGALTFKAQCTPCHASDGSGNTPTGKMMQAADLRSPDVQKLTTAELIGVVEDGKGAGMPSFATKLNANQIKDVISYVRTLAQKTTKAPSSGKAK